MCVCGFVYYTYIKRLLTAKNKRIKSFPCCFVAFFFFVFVFVFVVACCLLFFLVLVVFTIFFLFCIFHIIYLAQSFVVVFLIYTVCLLALIHSQSNYISFSLIRLVPGFLVLKFVFFFSLSCFCVYIKLLYIYITKYVKIVYQNVQTE